MKNLKIYIRELLIIILCLFLGPNIMVQDLTAEQIIKKADEKVRGKSSQGELTMTVVRPSWTREMSMKSWTVGEELALILVTAPARDAGITHLKRDKELWNWQPSIDRVIKLPPSMMLQSWMGSDFTNDDLVKESSMVKDYEQVLEGDSVVDGYDCYKIALIPKEDAPVVWGKIMIWITKDEFIQIRTEFYDEDGYLINVMKGTKIKDMDGRLLPSRLEMIPVDKHGHMTVIEHKSLKFDADLEDDFFSIQNMKRVR